MKTNTIAALFLSVIVGGLLITSACERDTSGLKPAPLDTNPVVFDDVFDGIDWQAFGNSKLDAFVYDDTQGYQSEASLRFDIPDPTNPSGAYAGGVIVSNTPRDLSQYNAVTFWARASKNATLNEVGFGNDNTGNSKYIAGIGGLSVKTYWQRYIIPIPTTGKLVNERGLFLVAEAEDGIGYQLWIDQVEFTNVDNISNPRPVMRQGNVSAVAGVEIVVPPVVGEVPNITTTVDVSGVPVTIGHPAAYFEVVGGGTAVITAKLGQTPVAGSFTVTAIDPPTDRAPTPTRPASSVISIYSNAYNDHPVDAYSTQFDQAEVSEIKIAGDDVLVYRIPTQLDVAAIEFATQLVDATNMTHIHIDIWVPGSTAATPFFGLGLISFGPDGVFSGDNPFPQGDDSVAIVAVVEPELVFGEWLSLDIPLTEYTNGTLDETAHLAQVFLRSDAGQLLVDNIYFYNDGN
jgi:hypothetical protein